MVKTSKIGVFVLTIIAGVLLYLNSSDNTNFGGVGLFLLSFFLGLLTSIFILLSDLINFKTTKSIKSFIPTIIGFIIISITFYELNNMNQPSDKDILIQAGYSPGVGASSLILRTDNSYEFFNGALLSSHILHGTFLIKDSFILLDREKVDKALISKKLLINSNAKIIFQVDSSGRRIENSIPFFIYIDKRRK